MLKAWYTFLVLAIGLVGGYAAKAQRTNKLVGRWKAMTPQGTTAFIVRDGDTVRYGSHPAYPVTYCFKPDGTGFAQWGNAPVGAFTYRLVNSGVVEFRGLKGKKTSRASFQMKGNALSFHEFPVPKDDKEEISLLYILNFVKQL